jgi:hypothetical protein
MHGRWRGLRNGRDGKCAGDPEYERRGARKPKRPHIRVSRGISCAGVRPFVRNGRMHACWCGLRNGGGAGSGERGCTKRGGQQTPEIRTPGVKRRMSKARRWPGLMFGVVITKWRGTGSGRGLYETRGAADARNTHAGRETAGVEHSAAAGWVFGVVTWHRGCRLWLFEGGYVGVVDGNGTAVVFGGDVVDFVRISLARIPRKGEGPLTGCSVGKSGVKRVSRHQRGGKNIPGGPTHTKPAVSGCQHAKGGKQGGFTYLWGPPASLLTRLSG